MSTLVSPVTTTALPNSYAPAPAISIFELVKEWVINAYRTFKNIDMYWVKGGHTITFMANFAVIVCCWYDYKSYCRC